MTQSHRKVFFSFTKRHTHIKTMMICFTCKIGKNRRIWEHYQGESYSSALLVACKLNNLQKTASVKIKTPEILLLGSYLSLPHVQHDWKQYKYPAMGLNNLDYRHTIEYSQWQKNIHYLSVVIHLYYSYSKYSFSTESDSRTW